ncbi:hypothetical protein [Virgibacillus sediminis]|uniref:SbsA Ig-like domain-containing protein n=1 Tax=Virgibacillus sediminis TaxID=202260 RepID=A0ABV7A379_9BACI
MKVFVNDSQVATPLTSEVSEDGKSLTLAHGALNQSDSVKVWIAGVTDVAGTEVEAFEETYTVTGVTAPTAEGIEVVNNKKVKLTFSEPVDLDTAGVYKTTDSNNISGTLKVDGELTFAKFTAVPEENAVEVEFFNALEDGDHTLTIEGTKDFAGFKVASKTFNFSTMADTTAPEATSVSFVGKEKVEVTFDEEVTNLATASFEVTQAGDSTDLLNLAGSGTASLKAGDNKTVVLDLATPFNVSATVGFDVKYKNVEDIFGNENTDFATISGQATDDSIKPEVSSVEVQNGNELKVTFSEKVNVATSQFELIDENGDTVATSATTVSNFDTTNPDGKTFKVTFNSLSNIEAANYKLAISGTTDTSIRTNTIEDVEVPFTAIDSKAPVVSSAVLKGDASGDQDKIEIRFSEAVDSSVASDINNYFVGKGAADVALSTVSGAKVESVSADGKQVVLLVPKADEAVQGQWTAAIDSVAAPAIKDQAGNLISNATISNPYTVSASYDPFEKADVKAYATGKNTIVVESTDPSNLFAANQPAGAFDFDLDTSSQPVDLGVTAAQVSADGKKVTLTFANSLTADAVNSGDKLELVVSANSGIKDQNGTELAPIAADNSTHTVADKIEATQTTTTVAGADIQIAFDEDVQKATGIDDTLLATGIEVMIDGTVLTPSVDYTATVDGNGDVVVTVIKSGVVADDVSVEIVRPQYLEDSVGNDVNVKSAVIAESVTEATAPTVTTPFGDGSTPGTTTVAAAATADIVFSETLSATGKTAVETAINGDTNVTAGDFTFTWDNSTLTIKNVSSNSITFAADVTANIEDVAGNTTTGATVINHE